MTTIIDTKTNSNNTNSKRNSAHNGESILKQNHTIHDDLQPPDQSTIRCYFQNIGGLRYSAGKVDLENIQTMIDTYEFSIVGLSEINIDTTKSHICRSVYEQVNRSNGQKICLSNSKITAKNTYKSGGVLQFSNGNLNRRFVSNISDPLGRWSVQGFVGKSGQHVFFFTLYMPCKKSKLVKGSTTAYAQQEQILRIREGKYVEPRKQFIKDLDKVLASIQFPSYSQCESRFVLSGDFNCDITTDLDLLTLCMKYKLIDIYYNTYGTRDFSTYTRGTTRIDFSLISMESRNSFLGGGYTRFGALIPSDHRGQYLIFQTKDLLGFLPDPLPRTQFRKLRSNHRATAVRYLKRLHRSLKNQNFFQRVKALLEDEKDDHKTAEVLDTLITSLSLSSENRLPNRSQVSYSEQLVQDKAMVTVRQLQRSQLLTNINYSEEIHAICEVNNLECPSLPSTVKEARHWHALSVKKVKESQVNHLKLRKNFLDDLISEITTENDPSNKKRLQDLKAIRATEKIIQAYKKIKFQRPSGLRQQINQIQVPIDPSDNPKEIEQQPEKWKLLMTQEEILSALLDRNIKHFGTAHGTPFTTDPLSSIFDYSASGDFLDQIQLQQEQLKELHVSTASYLRQMRESARNPLIQQFLAVQEVKNKFRKWRESTSTSPSGLHLGHWRTICMDYGTGKNTEEDKRIASMQEEILQARVNLLNYAIKWNYSFERWKRIITLMILKEKGNIKIHRMRILHLYEADFGALLGIKWRNLTFELYHNKHLHECLYGSVPNRSCHDPVILSELQYEISRLTRRPFAEGKGDAAGCYDNIIPSVTSAVSQTEGMPKTICVLHAKTLEEAKYYLKIMFDVSEEFYSNGTFTPIYGNGQGSTNSPSAWLFISNNIFKCHCKVASGAEYWDPAEKIVVRLYLAGFVDDTNLYANMFEADRYNVDDLVDQLRSDIQVFSELLWTTGGKLEPKKCNFTLMHWKFKENGEPYLDNTIHNAINITDTQGKICAVIKYIPPDVATKYLGHYKEVAGSQHKQERVLQQIINEETTFVATSHMNAELTYTYYSTMFLKKVTYPMGLTYFSKKKLRKMQQKYHRVLLQSLGFNKNTSKAVRYGSPLYAGIGIRCLYLEQGIQGLQQFIRHWRSNTNISQLLRITVAWCQLSLGTGISFLKDMNRDLPHFEAKWLKGLRSFLRHINGFIELDEDYVPPLQREGDKHVMDLVLNSSKFSPKQVKSINYCRIYLCVHTLSDLTKSNGKWIHPEFINGRHTKSTPKCTLSNILQQKPSPTEWKLWKKANLLWSTKSGKLHKSLGKWLVPVKEQRMLRFSYRDVTSGCVYLYNGHHFKQFDLYLNRLMHVPSGEIDEWAQIPLDVLPNNLRNSVWYRAQMDPNYSEIIPKPVQPTHNTFHKYVALLQVWEQSLLDDLHWYQGVDQCLEFMVENTILFGTDGSAKKNVGAFSWILSTDTGQRIIKNTGNSPGKDQYSFRAEAHAILSALLFYKHVSLFFKCKLDTKINIHTDSDSFIKRYSSMTTKVGKSQGINRCFLSEWDILQEIQSIIDTMEIQLRLYHVESHQDKKTAYDLLPLPVQLNIEADKLAGTRRLQSPGDSRSPLFSTTKAHLILDEDTITKRFSHHISFQYQQREMLAYLINRYGWTSHIFNSVKWEAIAMNVKHFNHWSFYVKWSNGILPTKYFINKYNPHESPVCPACKCAIETNEHLLQCPCYSQWRTSFFSELDSFFIKSNTHEALSRPLLKLVKSYCSGTLGQSTMKDHGIFSVQTSIGWKNFFRGHIAKVFQEFYELTDSHQDYWTFKLLRVIWKNIRELWDIRNKYEHGEDSSQKAHLAREKLLNELKAVYADKANVLATDRDTFYESTEQHLQHRPQLAQVKTWINMVKQTIQKSKKQAMDIATNGMKKVTIYFAQKNVDQRTVRRKKKKRLQEVLPRHHQTYIYFRPDNTMTTTLVPEQTAHTLTPKQIQPQIPWQNKYRQTKLSSYT